jgi:hypothetical protein
MGEFAMSVASIPQSVLANLGSVATTSVASGAPAGATSDAGSPTSANASAQVRSILAAYNLEEISPSELSTMTQQLQQAGALSPADFADLTQLRSQLDSNGTQPDETVDLLDFLNDKLSTQKKQLNNAVQKSPNGATGVNSDAYLGQTVRQLSLVQKLSTIQGPTAGDDPLDAVA